MQNTLHYHYMVKKLREFFHDKKGFIEVPAQSRTSILAACEQPETVTQYKLGNVIYPLPQTGQMWLEHELLKNPTWPGAYCITTSYRDEPVIIEGRHLRIFPMFEFEMPGTIAELRNLERELVTFLGFSEPVSILYDDACDAYESTTIEAPHELQLASQLGSVISLELFPRRTSPFWNMKRNEQGTYNKIDVLLHGMETIGSAERSCDAVQMREDFFTMVNGRYSQLLFDLFDRNRVLKELDEFLSLPMIPRFGGGIGLTRLARALELEGLFDTMPYAYTNNYISRSVSL